MDTLRLVAEGLGPPEIKIMVDGKEVTKKAFGIMVLVDPPTGGIHSVHLVRDQTPAKRTWDIIVKKGFVREIWVTADSVQDAFAKAFDRGILEAV